MPIFNHYLLYGHNYVLVQFIFFHENISHDSNVDTLHDHADHKWGECSPMICSHASAVNKV